MERQEREKNKEGPRVSSGVYKCEVQINKRDEDVFQNENNTTCENTDQTRRSPHICVNQT